MNLGNKSMAGRAGASRWLQGQAVEHAARTASAATVSLLTARLFGLPEAYWAAVTTLIVMQSDLGAAWTISIRRLLGTALGAALGEKAGLERGLLLDILSQTAVLTPGQKSKLENVRQGQYPTNFALSLQHKDLRLILNEANEVSVPMPATAAAQQMYTAALAKEMDEDFSVMIRFMQELAGLSDRERAA